MLCGPLSFQESEAAPQVEVLDSGEYGERRIVDHDAAARVIEGLEVAARPERPHDVGLLHALPLSHVVEHDGVHLRQPALGPRDAPSIQSGYT